MGYLAAWYQERPRIVEAMQLASATAIIDIAEWIGARSWHPTEVDVEFYDTAGGTLAVPWGDWIVRMHDTHYEVVPAPLFALVYEPSVL